MNTRKTSRKPDTFQAPELPQMCWGSKVPLRREVIFCHPTNGWPHDQQLAAKHLTVGTVYQVEAVEVGSSHTYLYLPEFPDVKFNSVLFSEWRDS